MGQPAPSAVMTAQWHLARIGWLAARDAGLLPDTSGIKVGVLDTGIDPHHPDLLVPDDHYRHEEQAQDILGHGTNVAGIIAAKGIGSYEVTGLTTAALHAWKIFPDTTTHHEATSRFVYYVEPEKYLRALRECCEREVDVLTVSIGRIEPPSADEHKALEALLDNGCVVIAAMGNDRRLGSPVCYPAAVPGVIAVGATDADDKVASFSNSGDHITLVAPGVNIWSTLPTYPGHLGFTAVNDADGSVRHGRAFNRQRNYGAWSGTSMAAPMVAGAAAIAIALLRQQKQTFDVSTIRNLLIGTADKVPGMKNKSFTPDYGFGRLNVMQLVQRIIGN